MIAQAELDAMSETLQTADRVLARRDAGELDILTLPEWHARVSQRSFPG